MILQEIFQAIKSFVLSLNAERIALLSLAVTFIIYVLGKRTDIKLRKHEAKKEQYIKLVNLYTEFIESYKLNKKINPNDAAWIRKFSDMGSSLAIYGSKKLYKTYVFSRSLENPIIQKSRYFDKQIVVYLYAVMFKRIRKEVGLNSFDTVSYNDILAFFVNDMGYNPMASKKAAKIIGKIHLLKVEMFFINVQQCVHINRLFYRCIYPIFGSVLLILKYLVLTPIMKILFIIFPKIETYANKQQ